MQLSEMHGTLRVKNDLVLFDQVVWEYYYKKSLWL